MNIIDVIMNILRNQKAKRPDSSIISMERPDSTGYVPGSDGWIEHMTGKPVDLGPAPDSFKPSELERFIIKYLSQVDSGGLGPRIRPDSNMIPMVEPDSTGYVPQSDMWWQHKTGQEVDLRPVGKLRKTNKRR